MKKLIPFLLLGLALVLGAYAAATFSRSAYRITHFGAEVKYGTAASTTPTAVWCTAVFKRNYTNDADATDAAEDGQLLNPTFNLLAAPATQTTVATGGGVTVTDAQLAALIRKRCETAAGL